MTSTSYREVAQRIFGTATNLLASGLVLILGIVLGRQMLASWSTESRVPVPIHPVHEHGNRDLDREHGQGDWLEFGDSSATVLRSEIRGDFRAAMAQLRHDCRVAAATGSPELTNSNSTFRDWLTRLGYQEPAEKNPGRWLLYELRQPMPMVVVVSDPQANPLGAAEQISAAERGVISWGLAFPADSGPASEAMTWTSFVVLPAPHQQKSAKKIGVVLPAECERLLALWGNDRSLIGFASSVEPAELAARWDSTQAAGGWRAVGDWQVTAATWHRRYERSASESVDVQFAWESPGNTLGFCLVREVRG